MNVHAIRAPRYDRSPVFASVVLALGCVAWCGMVRADLPTAQLTGIYPMGGKQGTSVEVTVSGADLDDADRLFFSDPAVTANPKMQPGADGMPAKPVPGVFTVTIPANAPTGLCEARVVSRFGVSNPRPFAVGIWDEAVEAGGNNQRDKAMEVKKGTVINGRTDGNSVDYYTVSLKAGERILVDCWAERIDSRLDGTLVLYSPDGRELLRSRDYAGRDPMLDFTASSEGKFLVALFDFTYGGGAEHYYRLVLHEGPHVDFVFPPSGVPGSTANYTLYGRLLPGGQPAEEVRSDRPLEKLDVPIALPNDETSLRQLAMTSLVETSSSALDSHPYRFGALPPISVAYAAAALVREIEPNGQAAQSQKIAVPAEVVGQFYPNKDEDWFQFDAKKGESYIIDLQAHRLGLNVDPYLLIQKITKNAQGEEQAATVAQVDDPADRAGRIGSDFDTSTDDPSFRLDVPEDGVYRVMVRDQASNSRRDPRLVYRLGIRPPQPDFALVAGSRSVQAPLNPNLVGLGGVSVRRGGTTLIEVTAIREDGFTGDIELTVEGLPEGITCPGAILGVDATAPLIISAAENAPRWEGTIKVVGKAKLGEQQLVRVARSATTVWGTPNRQATAARYRLCRDFALAVLDRETQIASLQVGDGNILETSKGGKLDIPIKIVRRGDFKADLALAPMMLPNELKPQNVAVKGDQADAQLALAATNANARPGIYTFYLRADAKVKHVRNPQAQAAVEEEQKAIDAKIAGLTEGLKKATEAKDAAVKAAQDAAAAVKTAEQAKAAADAEAKQAAETLKKAVEAAAAAKQQADNNAGNQDLANAAAAAEKAKTEAEAKNTAAAEKLAVATKAFEESQVKAKTADEAKVAAEKAAVDSDASLKAAQQAKPAIDKRLDEIKKANAPKDLDAAFLSTPVKVRIVESPIGLSVTVPAPSFKAGDKAELPVKLTRLYGFDGQVEISFEPPAGIAGLSAAKLTLPKEQAEDKLALVVDPKTPPGDHVVTIRAKSQFNNVNVEKVEKITLKIEAPAK